MALPPDTKVPLSRSFASDSEKLLRHCDKRRLNPVALHHLSRLVLAHFVLELLASICSEEASQRKTCSKSRAPALHRAETRGITSQHVTLQRLTCSGEGVIRQPSDHRRHMRTPRLAQRLDESMQRVRD